jgi:hypothetical protein
MNRKVRAVAGPIYPGSKPVPRLAGDDVPACADHPNRDYWTIDIVGQSGWDEAEAAAAICREECPLRVFAACAAAAADIKPPTGVWAGQVWGPSNSSLFRGRPIKRPPSRPDRRKGPQIARGAPQDVQKAGT